MIDRDRTIKEFGYDPDDFKPKSNKRVWAICEKCGLERLVDFVQYSELCRKCVKFGRIVSEETRQKHRENGTGVKASEETRQKMRKKRPSVSGKNHYKWNSNLTDDERNDKRNYPAYYEWRTLIYKRDNYTCQICSKRGHVLNAHHLDGYRNNPDKRILLENGITLCKECHDNFHHQYGYNNTKEQFIEFKANRE